jgi:hypothetical protein
MEERVQVFRLAFGDRGWVQCGAAAADDEALRPAVEELADKPGIYRARRVGAEDPWHFFYVDDTGRAIDSGAASYLD